MTNNLLQAAWTGAGRTEVQVRINSLNLLRFVTALIVVIFHFGRHTKVAALAPGFLTAGPQMVTFFFVLSGFVLTITYHGRGLFSAADYTWKRVGRIVPLYLLALSISVLLSASQGRFDPVALVLSAGFIQTWWPSYATAYNFPAWAISVQAFQYLVFPWLLARQRTGGTSPVGVALWAVALWLVSQTVVTWLLNSPFYQGYPSTSHDLLFYYPPVHLASFLMGIAAGRYVLANRDRLGPGRTGRTLLLVGLMAAFGVGLEYAYLVTEALGLELAFGAGFWSPLLAVLIAMLALSDNIVTRAMSAKPWLVLGEASFALYIFHAPVFRVYRRLLSPILDLHPDLDFWLFVLLLTLGSIAALYLLELPARSLIFKFRDKLRAA